MRLFILLSHFQLFLLGMWSGIIGAPGAMFGVRCWKCDRYAVRCLGCGAGMMVVTPLSVKKVRGSCDDGSAQCRNSVNYVREK